jgi:hypothetical protein
MEVRNVVISAPAPPPAPPPPAPLNEACSASFQLGTKPGEWAVIGRYSGRATLTPKGLALDVGGWVAADRPVDVRGIVFGIAQMTGGGSWSVTHRAEPITVGHLDAAAPPSPVRHSRPFIPGVGPAELNDGWLVVEHVLEAPEQPGGTAWTYVHADRNALRPILSGGCHAFRLLSRPLAPEAPVPPR